MNGNCGICMSTLLADEHLSRCLHCRAFVCEVCTGEGLQLCAGCVNALAPRDTLGSDLERVVVIADGKFWFETDELSFLGQLENSGRAFKRLDVWIRRERGSELYCRIGETLADLECATC